MDKLAVIFSFLQIIWIIVPGQILAAQNSKYDALQATYFGAPEILYSKREMTVNTGVPVEISCKSKKPITWTLSPLITPYYSINLEHASVTEDDGNVYHHATLKIPDIEYQYVGYYYCINNKSLTIEDVDFDSEVESYRAASIYIYVNDPDHLVAESENVIIEALQYSDAVIPCKPTVSTVNVQLYKDGDEESPIDKTNYDQKVGYSLHINEITDSGTYTCIVEDDPATSVEYHLTVHGGSATRYITKPTIVSETNEHTTIGGKIKLNCSLEMEVGVKFMMAWYLPNGEMAKTDGRILVSSMEANSHPRDNLKHIHSIALVVENVSKEVDAGVYKCQVKDSVKNHNSNTIAISVLESSEGFLDLYEESGMTKLVVSKNRRKIKIVIKYKSHPELENIIWLNNRNELMNEIPGKKYHIQQTDNSLILNINDIELSDSGIYSLKAINGLYEKEYNMSIIIRDKPKVSLKDTYVKEGEEAVIECDTYGYPASVILWSFQACSATPSWPTCSGSSRRKLDGEDIQTAMDSLLTQKSTLRFIPMQAGRISCTAKNEMGETSIESDLLISDIDKSFMVWGVDSKDIVVVGDSINLHCATLVYNYTNTLTWYKDENEVQGSSTITLVDENTEYSNRRELQINDVSKTDEGMYECRGVVAATNYQMSEYFQLKVFELQYPRFEEDTTLDDNSVKMQIGESYRLVCDVSGIPIPQIIWYKDNEVLNVEEHNDSRISITDGGKILEFTFLVTDHGGDYKCEATNKMGTISRSLSLEISGKASKYGKIIAYSVPTVVSILIIIIIFMLFKYKKQKRFVDEMKAAGLANFEDGNPDSLNPELTLDEQADLLPYDKNFEFPRDKLKLGKQLGAGAFGVVIKAVAQGILPYEEETTVAVKMVKKQTDNEVMRALISELKIMVHLGKHLNVVNLLGAVTKNISKREVMVIVEYCQFGNIQSFLLKHRPYFIDQINVKTDEIDPSIMHNDLRWSHNSGYAFNRELAGVSSGDPRNHMNSGGYVRHSGMPNTAIDSCNTEATLIPDDESIIHSNNVDGPFWCTNYGMDYKGPARSVTTSDLVCWAYQVARGMDYLASRKVLHGDLAARNILLCEDNIVKICDFGLARSMYKTDNYKKTGEAPLPFKWLAIESISDHVFSTYSDVWAFGIVLWEMFSLAKVPYPGMEANQTLYKKLRDGYRMEKPQFANRDLYDIMLNCWNITPDSRPQFSELDVRLGALLQDTVRDHYLDLNSPYLAMNADLLGGGQTDYLALMGTPDQVAPAPPPPSHYVNGHITPFALDINETDYLNMTPKSGRVKYVSGAKLENDFDMLAPNSPTIAKNLDNSPNLKHRSKNPGISEETPMLYRNSSPNNINSDSDSDINSPNSNNKDDNLFPELSSDYNNKNKNNTSTFSDTPSENSYINMPTTVNNLKNKDAFTNPSYVTVNTVNERAN